MNIIDAFVFYNEIDVLKMRLELTYDYVDYFCICESDHTFSGKKKDRFYNLARGQFARWEKKIIYLEHCAKTDGFDFSQKDESTNYNSPAWILEHDQRNYLKAACLQNSNKDDCIIVSDVDEFVDPTLLSMLKTNEYVSNFDIARLEMINHYYFMNCRQIGEGKTWRFPYIIKSYKMEEIENISLLRSFQNIDLSFQNAGWHFSYLGGPKQIMSKITSFSHTEFDKPEFNNEENIKSQIRSGRDIFHRNAEFAFYPIDAYPQSIQELMIKNKDFVKWSLV